MIEKIFFSDNNKDILKQIINEDYKENNNINLQSIINKNMNYVINNVSKEPPKNMNNKEYLFLMNKKVYDLSSKQINNIIRNSKKVEKKEPNQNNISSESKRIENNVFDNQILSQYETPPVIDYPKPGNSSNEGLLLNNKVDEIQREREEIHPKQKEVKFEDEKKDEANNTVDLYNDLLSTYNQQLMNMDNFEKENKKINKEVEDKETIENLNYQMNKLTPINNLNQENIKLEDDIISKDVGSINNFNRNDPSLFSNNNYDLEPSINHIDDNNYVNYNGKDLNYSGNRNKYDNIMINEPNFNIIDKSYYVVFNSKWRDLGIYITANDFQIKFAPASNSFLFKKYEDENGFFILNEKTIFLGDNSTNNVGETFDNIKNIELTNIIVPTYTSEYLRLGTDKLQHSNNLYKDNYLLLEIPELTSNFRGGNTIFKKSFAKLGMNYSNIKINDVVVSNFLDLHVDKQENNQNYTPVSGGKMDKMTLRLVNKNGRLYNFGLDKLYINNFQKGSLKRFCDQEIYTTKFDIIMTNDEYLEYNNIYMPNLECKRVVENPIEYSDLLYFYYKIPNNDQLAYFNDEIKVNDIKIDKSDNTIRINLYYMKDNKKVSVNFINFIKFINSNNSPLDNFYFTIIEKQKYDLKVKRVTQSYLFLEYYSDFPTITKSKITRLAFSLSNNSGNFSNSPNSLFTIYGHNVISSETNNDIITVDINFPYDYLPYYIQNNLFSNGDLFLIQDKKQITYTFKITSNIKDYQKLDSYLNESGNN